MPIRIEVKIYVLCVKNFGKTLIFDKVTATLNFYRITLVHAY